MPNFIGHGCPDQILRGLVENTPRLTGSQKPSPYRVKSFFNRFSLASLSFSVFVKLFLFMKRLVLDRTLSTAETALLKADNENLESRTVKISWLLGLVSITRQMPRPRHKNKAIIRLNSHPSR